MTKDFGLERLDAKVGSCCGPQSRKNGADAPSEDVGPDPNLLIRIDQIWEAVEWNRQRKEVAKKSTRSSPIVAVIKKNFHGRNFDWRRGPC